MSVMTKIDPLLVLDSISDGVYVTDLDRQIIYWSRSAERITGWPASEVVGKHCHDGILCHIDKDGHLLCGHEYCPLHRSIVSGNQSKSPIIIFGQSSDGRRIPMQVSVSPIRDAAGNVVGGVETFHDLSDEIHDFERAKKIQTIAMRHDLPPDDRIAFRTHYVPKDIVGGDFHAMTRLSEDCYGFILADVSGHGVAAALYTMFLRSLWDTHKGLLANPAQFAKAMCGSLCGMMNEDAYFAAALCGMVDLRRGRLSLTSAGNPSPLLFPSGAESRVVPCNGLPLGLFESAEYTETTVDFSPGDRLLMFSDGATEVTRKDGSMLDTQGLLDCLKAIGYPRRKLDLADVEVALLKASNRIRFDDDLSFMEITRKQ